MSTPIEDDGLRALALLEAEDARNDKIHELLETIREQIRVEIAPEHRPDGLMTNIQNAVYAMRGRTRLANDAAITSPLRSSSAVDGVGEPAASDDPESIAHALEIMQIGAPYSDVQGNLYCNPRYSSNGGRDAEFKDYGLARAVRIICNNAAFIRSALSTTSDSASVVEPPRPILTDEAVERAARAIYALDPYGNGAVGDVPWDELDSGRYHEGADHKATCLAQARDALTAAFSPAPESAPSGAAMIDAMPDAEFDRDRSLENPTVGKLTKPAPSSPVPVEAVAPDLDMVIPISKLHGDIISRIMPFTREMTDAEAEALGLDVLEMIIAALPAAPAHTEVGE